MFGTLKHFFAGLEDLKPVEGPAKNSLSPYDPLEQILGYHFSDLSILTLALTHKSCTKPEDDPHGLKSNERLEFLGDAILDFLVTHELFSRYPDQAEGQLSKMKSLIVSRKILGIIAEQIHLEKYVRKGKSEKKNNYTTSNSIGSNAFEALVGAVFLDGSIEDVRIMLERLLFPSMEFFLNDVDNGNFKSKILELSQSEGFGIPQYPLLSEEGPDHMKKFTVAIEIAGVRMGVGTGKNKKEAQQEAARVAVTDFNKELITAGQSAH